MSWYQHILEQHTLNISIHLPPAFDLILVHWCIGSNGRLGLAWRADVVDLHFTSWKSKLFPKLSWLWFNILFIWLNWRQTATASFAGSEQIPNKVHTMATTTIIISVLYHGFSFIKIHDLYCMKIYDYIVSKNLSIHIRVIYAYT